jgi:GWxTD domain-containing protein
MGLACSLPKGSPKELKMNGHKYFGTHASLGFLLTLFCLLVSCKTIPQNRYELDASSREFLSKVRYTITKQEKNIFLSTPPEKRQEFVNGFWKKRDPDASTEINEFKEEYFRRLEISNALFKEGTTPGWLQDRGRIYIILGPPDNRSVNPGFKDFHYENWYYEPNYVIVFEDRDLNGEYMITREGEFTVMNILKDPQQSWRVTKVNDKKVVFAFELKILEESDGQQKIQMKIPFNNIWMSDDGEKLETTLTVTAEIENSTTEERIWNTEKEFVLSLTEEELENMAGESYTVEIPLSLPEGSYAMTIVLENSTGEEAIQRHMTFKI